MAGSGDNAGPRDEQGQLIHFPRSSWVPEDGVEPLGAAPAPPGDATTATLEAPGREVEAFEADDFWDSGDTQQFVGSGRAAPPVPPDECTLEPEAADARISSRRLALLTWGRFSLPRPSSFVAAALVLASLAGTSVVIELLTAPGAKKLADYPAASRAHASASIRKPRPRVAVSIRRHRVAASHRKKPHTTTKHATVVATTRSTATPAAPQQPVHQTQPTYQSASRAVAASSDSGSSSGSQHQGPSGTVSLIGAGTSPSG